MKHSLTNFIRKEKKEDNTLKNISDKIEVVYIGSENPKETKAKEEQIKEKIIRGLKDRTKGKKKQ